MNTDLTTMSIDENNSDCHKLIENWLWIVSKAMNTTIKNANTLRKWKDKGIINI